MLFTSPRSIPEPDINQPITETSYDKNFIEAGCLTLIVSVDSERRLRVNTDEVGTLADTSKLVILLKRVFQEREDNHAFKPRMESRGDLPTSERIMKSVLIEASPTLTYGELMKLLNIVTQAGADPVALQISELGSHKPYEFSGLPLESNPAHK
jgi:biopolymer transport protein ExbD